MRIRTENSTDHIIDLVDRTPTLTLTEDFSTPNAHFQSSLPGLVLPVGSSALLAHLGTPAPSPESSCAVFTWQPGWRLVPSFHPPGEKPSQGLPKEEGAIYTPAGASDLLSLTGPLFRSIPLINSQDPASK